MIYVVRVSKKSIVNNGFLADPQNNSIRSSVFRFFLADRWEAELEPGEEL